MGCEEQCNECDACRDNRCEGCGELFWRWQLDRCTLCQLDYCDKCAQWKALDCEEEEMQAYVTRLIPNADIDLEVCTACWLHNDFECIKADCPCSQTWN